MSDIGSAITAVIPWLTTALTSGPVGIAAMAATKIAGVLGLSDSTIDNVKKVITAGTITPEQQLALKQEEDKFELQMRQMGFSHEEQMRASDNDTLAIINKTMQAEYTVSNWYAADWRPTWGYASAALFIFVGVVAGILALYACFWGKVEFFELIPKFILAFVPLFTIAGAVLGIQAYKDGNADLILAGMMGKK